MRDVDAQIRAVRQQRRVRLALAVTTFCVLFGCSTGSGNEAALETKKASLLEANTTTTEAVQPITTELIPPATAYAPTTTVAPTTTAPPTATTAPPPPPPPTPAPVPASSCHPSYSPCVPNASDVDCAGGSGNGPEYVQGPVQVIGFDGYDLDRDGDGLGCED